MSDLHFSHIPPTTRSVEKDWYAVQERHLGQLYELRQSDPNNRYIPIICGGDFFNTWREPSELVNFLLARMSSPSIYSVAGQHDLPFHNYKDIRKSAYWTLVEAGKIINLGPERPVEVIQFGDFDLTLHGFPFGTRIEPCDEKPHTFNFHMAVAHSYIWTKETGFPDAPAHQRLKQYKSNVRGYDVLLTGDNHSYIKAQLGKCLVFNPGSFMRRYSNEIKHRPCVGLFKTDGSIETRYLDVSKDQFLPPDIGELVSEDGIDMGRLMDEFRSLKNKKIEFKEFVKHYLEREGVKKSVRKEVVKALEEGK